MFKWIATASVVILTLWGIGSYNGLVNANEGVLQSYAQIANVMQRQADLIPNQAEVVKGSAQHEKDTLTAVTQARSGLSNVANMKPDELAKHPELIAAATAGLQQAMLNIKVTCEQYPDLKANALYDKLFNSLEGSINRITVERRSNQLIVASFNASVRRIPGSLVASIGGFKAYPYFEADEAAKATPKVKMTHD